MDEDRTQMDLEHKAWIKMFNTFRAVLEIETGKKIDANHRRFRNFFCDIEEWGQEMLRLRYTQQQINKVDIMTQDLRVLKRFDEVK